MSAELVSFLVIPESELPVPDTEQELVSEAGGAALGDWVTLPL